MRLRKFPWSDQWYVVWRDKTRSRRLSTRTADRAEAERFLARVEQEINAPPLQPTIDTICDGYLKDRQGKVSAHATLEHSLKPVRTTWGSLEPKMLTRHRVAAYVRHRRAENRSNSTINKELRTLRQALAWAVRSEWIDKSPHIDIPAQSAPRDRWLTREEAQRLIAGCTPPHLRMFVMLALHTGARKTAILDLTWDRVDLERGLIFYALPDRVYRTKRRATVPINATLRVELEKAMAAATCEWVVEYAGQRVRYIETGFREARKRADLSDVRIHDLRHTCATWMVQAGISTAKVARYLADSERTIERVYGHHSPSYLDDAARALED